jgi:hypothetical protein
MRELMTSLCDDIDYQYRLRADFRRRRVHPAIETRVWDHVVGKPVERVQLAADVTMNQKLEEERELFLKLSVEQLEELAAESQALVDKARAMLAVNALPPAPANVRRAPVEDGNIIDVHGSTSPITDVARSDLDDSFNTDGAQPRGTPVLVAVSPSPTAGVQEDTAGEPAEDESASRVR